MNREELFLPVKTSAHGDSDGGFSKYRDGGESQLPDYPDLLITAV
jgi:hypothetical protein